MSRRLILCCLALATLNVHAACSEADRQQMKSGGMDEARVEALCGSNKPAPRKVLPPAIGKTCQTEEMRCPLPEPGKLADTCWCSGPAGAVSGVVVR